MRSGSLQARTTVRFLSVGVLRGRGGGRGARQGKLACTPEKRKGGEILVLPSHSWF